MNGQDLNNGTKIYRPKQSDKKYNAASMINSILLAAFPSSVGALRFYTRLEAAPVRILVNLAACMSSHQSQCAEPK